MATRNYQTLVGIAYDQPEYNRAISVLADSQEEAEAIIGATLYEGEAILYIQLEESDPFEQGSIV